ncbi:MAG: hypothetical protein QMD77_04225 [Patescibacteria group bacterium]|nr:hypothetical protein [Patescibacteria group bacterium]
MTRCLPLRNIVLIPGLIGKPESDKILSRCNIRSIVENLSREIAGLRSLLPLAERFREFPWQSDKGGLNSLLLAGFLIEINNAYLQFRWSKPGKDSLEPGWFFSLPREIKGHLRTAFFLSQLNPYLNFPITIPFTGVQYIFRRGGPMDKLILNSDFERLAELGQLANLILWDHNKKNNQPFPRVPEHSRFTHSMGTHGLMDPVTFNNCRRLPPLLRLTLSVSSLLHDIGMPAGGDGIKPLNPKYLAEEKAVVEVLRREPWQVFFWEIGVSPQLVIDIIRNEDRYGLGESQSWVDRIDYTADDTFEYLGGFCQKNPASPEPRDFFIGHPDALTVWDCIELVPRDGKYLTVFNNPEKLGNFLELRALNLRHIYYAPESRSQKNT